MEISPSSQVQIPFFVCWIISAIFLFTFHLKVCPFLACAHGQRQKRFLALVRAHIKVLRAYQKWLIKSIDRLGGAKADRRKEAAIANAVEAFLNEIHTAPDDGNMSRAKMVKFFNYCFPSFLKIVINVVRNEKIVDFSNNSVFQKSSRIPLID